MMNERRNVNRTPKSKAPPIPLGYPSTGLELTGGEKCELEELEVAYGRKLNAMSDTEIVSLIGPSRSTPNLQFRMRDPASRLDLLRKLKARLRATP